MKNTAKRRLLIALGGLAALWIVTGVDGPASMRRSLLTFMTKASQNEIKRIPENEDPSKVETIILHIPGYPRAEVSLLSCPAPFIFHARWGGEIAPSRNISGGTGWFFYTPWRSYQLDSGRR
jgi:hypothetical protein